MKKYLVLSLLLFSTAAFATNNNGDDEGCRGNCGSTTQPVSYDQDQGQSQGQHQGQAQGQGQSQEANAAAAAAASASNHTAVGVGVGVDTRDYNANSNTALGGAGGRGGEGGVGLGVGGNQAQQQGISDSGNSTARGGDQEQSINASGNSSNSNVNSNRNDSTAINEGNNAAQSTEITFEAAESYRHTPDATAPGIYTSNSCAQGFGAGASAPGYGLSVGGNKIDKGCTVRENARILAGVDSALAIEYLCRNKHVDIGETLGDLCKPKLVPEPPVVIYPEPEVPVTVIVDDVKG